MLGMTNGYSVAIQSLLNSELRQLKNNTEKLGYRNLLSWMTLSLENLHSTMNKKYGTQTVLTYAQSFATSMKESVEWENHIKQESVSSSWKHNETRRVKISQTKKNHRYYPRTKKEKCENGYNQIMLLSDKEAESSKAVRKTCQNTGLLWSVFSHILTESYPYFPLFGQSWKNYPTAGKCGS